MSTELTVVKQPENWIHFSSTASQIVMSNKGQDEILKSGMYFKPKGLWITPEYAPNNWRDWCMGEDFRTGDLNFIHDVKFKPDANLLRLENAQDIDIFTDQYGYSLMATMLAHDPSVSESHRAWRENRRDAVHWDKVAEKYDGILIPNYIFERRFMHGADWYYPWDCASGCVWSCDAVESITVRPIESAGYVTREFDMKKAMKALREATEKMRDGV